MSNGQANTQASIPGFWERLRLALEDISASHTERLEKQVWRLEAEVERLSATEKMFATVNPKR